ncbi:Cadmium, zinc and cobalt-transporting ATPase [Sebaldella termitidis]|jgi:copper chaperone CopZ|uniref:Heavy metal transport/detoxification protein n=1 Tax=Sebaldella termitidis (strain ATCC 33386 / NCTC 11300) TaxID=526218 RepID=D1AM34_SEBTE|nr:cation transporter [Sebaldella termitidis]ACZ09408.1 Heavy metal transport/detoxification protein [Sebaldella termitidis ATCC 33386]SUI24730.1 Cadmium, zinc and cobalt-transporting ATPase [Sebaldella termitidis]
MKKTFRLENLDCANCAAKIERSVQKVEGVNSVNVNFMTAKMNLELVDENSDSVIEEIKKTVKKIESAVIIKK